MGCCTSAISRSGDALEVQNQIAIAANDLNGLAKVKQFVIGIRHCCDHPILNGGNALLRCPGSLGGRIPLQTSLTKPG